MIFDFQLLPGALLVGVVVCVLQVLYRGVQYLRSGGGADRVAEAKNTIIYGLMGAAASSFITFVGWMAAGPATAAQIFQGMAVGAVISAGMSLILSSAVVPAAVAAYSAWWMPKAERTVHRQDIRYALRQADWSKRSSHAWGVLKSSPRVGLRARRHHKRLAAAMTGPPVRRQVSS